MNWTDEIPPWLPPIGGKGPRHHRGRALIIIGLTILSGFMVFAIVLSAVGGRHTIYGLLVGAIGLILLITGLLRRNRR
ncbi:hypothetical protein [Arthrobacter sp. M4]|uniref:hypothetical protein n=1 Tax=Arthrobacter sp. M4 TaxID=218160 RepID=UPI001CDBA88D|nr:hypothetical protein [Arthrobacter sp. M4]MCA4133116.1 hypothetical protein [Arthrobacter sp. M4]